MPTDGEGPLPGDLILHTCNGHARWWRLAGDTQTCLTCASPLGGDLPPIEGHAQVWCDHCKKWIGICASEELADIAEAARRILLASAKRKRKGQP